MRQSKHTHVHVHEQQQQQKYEASKMCQWAKDDVICVCVVWVRIFSTSHIQWMYWDSRAKGTAKEARTHARTPRVSEWEKRETRTNISVEGSFTDTVNVLYVVIWEPV